MWAFQNLHVLQKIGAEKVQWAQHFINRGFQGWWKLDFDLINHYVIIRFPLRFECLISPPGLEPILKQTSGKYCVGDEVRAGRLETSRRMRSSADFSFSSLIFF